jgi:hypothetical protein
MDSPSCYFEIHLFVIEFHCKIIEIALIENKGFPIKAERDS